MNVSRRNTAPVIVDRKEINYTNKTKILGMTYSTHGISPQVEIRKVMAMKTLTRLQRFRNLSEKNKRKLYLANNRKTATSIPNHSIKQYLKNCT